MALARRPTDTLRIVLRGTLESYEMHGDKLRLGSQGQHVRMHRKFGCLAETYRARELIGEGLHEGGHLQRTTIVGGKPGLLLALHGCDFR